MRIHLNADLSVSDLAKAAAPAEIAETVTTHQSRRAHHAVDVYLSGSSGRRARMGRADYRAATWDEWGVFLSAVFTLDPTAQTGDYHSPEHFHWATGYRFRTPHLPENTHRQHRFTRDTAATGTYEVLTCDTCDAIMRRPLGHTPAERRANLATILGN